MKICRRGSDTEKTPTPTPGCLYENDLGQLYMCGIKRGSLYLFNLVTGNVWAEDGGFGGSGDFREVTDRYCIQKLEDLK